MKKILVSENDFIFVEHYKFFKPSKAELMDKILQNSLNCNGSLKATVFCDTRRFHQVQFHQLLVFL
jgi:hypothetical protein